MTGPFDHIDPADLPASLREVIEIIGLPATLKLVENWGGLIALYIPRNINTDHPLARQLGLEAAFKLTERWGGDYLRNIPKATAALRAARNREIIARRAAGESAAKLALEYGVTERQIWNVQSNFVEDRQQNLDL